MTRIEALRAELKCYEMVDGTILGWWDVVRLKGRNDEFLSPPPLSHYVLSALEFALGVVEGKPVWEGDMLWLHGERVIPSPTCAFSCYPWSWNPPKPETVTVELCVKDAKWMANAFNSPQPGSASKIAAACRKAMEGLK